MDYAIEVLQEAIKRVKQNLYRLDKSKQRSLNQAGTLETDALQIPEMQEHYANMARGCRDKAAWVEGVAIPTEQRKLAELEEALTFLQNRERPVVRVSETQPEENANHA